MEFIKKTIYLITTTGTTGSTGSTKVVPANDYVTNPDDVYLGWTGATGGTGFIRIPDTGMTYYMKVLLTQEIDDIGFLDAYPLSGVTGTTNDIDYSGYTGGSYVVTGGCMSRLSELKKYAITAFTSQYFGGGSYSVDGVDYTHSTGGTIVYYLGGIRYVDISGSTTGTTFMFTTTGINSGNFINVPVYKDPAKENIISNPKIDDDVFIVRQALSAFENNYRLEQIKNLSELKSYAGGKYFNIVNNT